MKILKPDADIKKITQLLKHLPYLEKPVKTLQKLTSYVNK